MLLLILSILLGMLLRQVTGVNKWVPWWMCCGAGEAPASRGLFGKLYL
jgi:hypothetical protein